VFPLRSNLITASSYDKYSVGPSIRPICTRCCFKMTDMIQVCSDFHQARAFITHTRPDEILGRTFGAEVDRSWECFSPGRPLCWGPLSVCLGSFCLRGLSLSRLGVSLLRVTGLCGVSLLRVSSHWGVSLSRLFSLEGLSLSQDLRSFQTKVLKIQVKVLKVQVRVLQILGCWAGPPPPNSTAFSSSGSTCVAVSVQAGRQPQRGRGRLI
jgi:hypothetical protein